MSQPRLATIPCSRVAESESRVVLACNRFQLHANGRSGMPQITLPSQARTTDDPKLALAIESPLPHGTSGISTLASIPRSLATIRLDHQLNSRHAKIHSLAVCRTFRSTSGRHGGACLLRIEAALGHRVSRHSRSESC